MSPIRESPICLYHNAPAICLEYDPRAPIVGRFVSNLITRDLPAVMVEHIGSTAVDGCAGKGIIDLMVLYPAGQLETVKRLLDELGFQRQTGRNPFPEDRPMRVGAVEYDGSLFRLHAHVIWDGSPEVKRLREFRDRLKSEERLRRRYEAKKREIIASGVTDTVDYAAAKGEFVKEVLGLDE